MERYAITVRGQVQGVGFRPFVFRLAAGLELAGEVHNRAGEVRIDVEGDGRAVTQFIDALTCRPPPLAGIDELVCRRRRPRGARSFRIGAKCDLAAVRRNIEAVRPGLRVFELSAKSGAGWGAWLELLESKRPMVGGGAAPRPSA